MCTQSSIPLIGRPSMTHIMVYTIYINAGDNIPYIYTMRVYIIYAWVERNTPSQLVYIYYDV